MNFFLSKEQCEPHILNDHPCLNLTDLRSPHLIELFVPKIIVRKSSEKKLHPKHREHWLPQCFTCLLHHPFWHDDPVASRERVPGLECRPHGEDPPPLSNLDIVLAPLQARPASHLLRNQLAMTKQSAGKFYHPLVEILPVWTPKLLCSDTCAAYFEAFNSK